MRTYYPCDKPQACRVMPLKFLALEALSKTDFEATMLPPSMQKEFGLAFHALKHYVPKDTFVLFARIGCLDGLKLFKRRYEFDDHIMLDAGEDMIMGGKISMSDWMEISDGALDSRWIYDAIRYNRIDVIHVLAKVFDGLDVMTLSQCTTDAHLELARYLCVNHDPAPVSPHTIINCFENKNHEMGLFHLQQRPHLWAYVASHILHYILKSDDYSVLKRFISLNYMDLFTLMRSTFKSHNYVFAIALYEDMKDNPRLIKKTYNSYCIHPKFAEHIWTAGKLKKEIYFAKVCEKGDFDTAVKMIVEGDFDTTANGSAAFRYACGNGHTKLAALLLDTTLSDYHAYKDGAFRCAAVGGHLDTAQCLYSLGGIRLGRQPYKSFAPNVREWIDSMVYKTNTNKPKRYDLNRTDRLMKSFDEMLTKRP